MTENIKAMMDTYVEIIILNVFRWGQWCDHLSSLQNAWFWCWCWRLWGFIRLLCILRYGRLRGSTNSNNINQTRSKDNYRKKRIERDEREERKRTLLSMVTGLAHSWVSRIESWSVTIGVATDPASTALSPSGSSSSISPTSLSAVGEPAGTISFVFGLSRFLLGGDSSSSSITLFQARFSTEEITKWNKISIQLLTYH